MSKFLFSIILILGSLFLGYVLQKLSHARMIRLPLTLEDLRKILQKCALLFVVPITFISAVWIIDMDLSLVVFPFLGPGAYLVGGAAAIGISRFLKLPPAKAGAMFTCGYFCNVGSIGGLVSYLFLGEQAFALVGLYKLFEPLSYYVIGFSVAKNYSLQARANISLALRIKKLFSDPFVLVNSLSLALGALLNVSGLERPAIFMTINALFIPLGTALLLISIGLSLRFSRITRYLRECAFIAAIKFVLVPICLSLVALCLGYGGINNGLPLKVVMILSAMPIAFNAVVATSVYDLDVDLTNSCLVFTSLCMIPVLPALYYLTR